jgi:CubicO group peptidase (beta-lactamase class C family)
MNAWNRLLLTVAIATCVTLGVDGEQAGHAPRADGARFDALVSLAEVRMKELGVPGVALGVLQDGRVTTRGLGVTNVEDPLPVTPHTVFPIASISKTFAATMAMRLAEAGTLDLSSPVRKYLPGFRVQDETASRGATIMHLLTHTGGWEGQVSAPDRGDDTLTAFVADLMPKNMQVAPPGAAWSYNNAGFSTLGRVIEVVTGKTIHAAARDLLFTPLELAHAGTTAGAFIVNRFAAGHTSPAGEAPVLVRPFVPSAGMAAGGVGLCITDLMTWARFHLGDGTAADGTRLLHRTSLERMRTPQLRKHATDDDMGIGWHLRHVGGVLTASHGGTLAGHILLLEIVPERSFAMAILTNASAGWRLIQDVERAALREYLGASYAENQAVAHRGLVETLPAVEPLAVQPDLTPYVGRFVRPTNAIVVRADGPRLVVQDVPMEGRPRPDMPVAFFGPDRAVVTAGPSEGQAIEFVRDASGHVQWVRVTGRVAVRRD